VPPPLALLLTLCFIGFLLRWEARLHQKNFGALWLPTIWIFFVASRFPGQWLPILGVPLGGGGEAGTTSADGSPLDALFLLVLIVLGINELLRRRLDFNHLRTHSLWVVIFFGYCFLAITWSDFPFVAFKRWIKIIGHPVMALIILTERDRVVALCRVLSRAGFMLLPLSVLFIKYYPQYGRGFDAWSGMATNQGVCLNKNELGYNCLIFCLFFVWNLLMLWKQPKSRRRTEQLAVVLGFIAMTAWLLRMANSATSLACLSLGIGIMVVVAFRWISKRHFGTIVIVTAIVVAILESSLDIYASTLRMLGRDPNLTDRTEVWEDVLAYPINPLLGAGFESFWLGDRLKVLWEKWWWQPNQAHSGYIETYINLGFAGLAILVGWIISAFKKSQKELLTDFDFGRFRMAFLFAMLFYNYTEAAFKGVHFMWTMFHIISMDYPPRARALAAAPSAPPEREAASNAVRA